MFVLSHNTAFLAATARTHTHTHLLQYVYMCIRIGSARTHCTRRDPWPGCPGSWGVRTINFDPVTDPARLAHRFPSPSLTLSFSLSLSQSLFFLPWQTNAMCCVCVCAGSLYIYIYVVLSSLTPLVSLSLHVHPPLFPSLFPFLAGPCSRIHVTLHLYATSMPVFAAAVASNTRAFLSSPIHNDFGTQYIYIYRNVFVFGSIVCDNPWL